MNADTNGQKGKTHGKAQDKTRTECFFFFDKRCKQILFVFFLTSKAATDRLEDTNERVWIRTQSIKQRPEFLDNKRRKTAQRSNKANEQFFFFFSKHKAAEIMKLRHNYGYNGRYLHQSSEAN